MSEKISQLSLLSSTQLSTDLIFPMTKLGTPNTNPSTNLGNLATFLQPYVNNNNTPFPAISTFSVSTATGIGYPPDTFVQYDNPSDNPDKGPQIYKNTLGSTNHATSPSAIASGWSLATQWDFILSKLTIDLESSNTTYPLKLTYDQYVADEAILNNDVTGATDYYNASVTYRVTGTFTIPTSGDRFKYLVDEAELGNLNYISGWTKYPKPADVHLWLTNNNYVEFIKGMQVIDTSGIYECVKGFYRQTGTNQVTSLPALTNTTYFKPILLLSTVGTSANLYVDTLAMAGGNGSVTAPFNTLNDVIDYVVTNSITGKAINLASGNYSLTGSRNLWTGNSIRGADQSVLINYTGTGYGFDINATPANYGNIFLTNFKITTSTGKLFRINENGLINNYYFNSTILESTNTGTTEPIYFGDASVNFLNCEFRNASGAAFVRLAKSSYSGVLCDIKNTTFTHYTNQNIFYCNGASEGAYSFRVSNCFIYNIGSPAGGQNYGTGASTFNFANGTFGDLNLFGIDIFYQNNGIRIIDIENAITFTNPPVIDSIRRGSRSGSSFRTRLMNNNKAGTPNYVVRYCNMDIADSGSAYNNVFAGQGLIIS